MERNTNANAKSVTVAINCITYNHEPYIREALEGFVMQKTNFPFVAIVHDDASTDGTAAIIREYAEKYPDIIKPIYETENQYSKHDGSFGRIMQEARNATGAKYVAFCEGDDYWTDPLKLQKQVDYLESHPDYSLVAHNCIEMWEDGSQEPKPYRQLEDGDVAPLDILKFCPFQTASLVLRAEILNSEKYQKAKNYKILAGDRWLMMCCSYFGKVYYFNDIMSVYRKHPGGISFENWYEHQVDHIMERRYFGIEFGPEIKEFVDKSVNELLVYEIVMGLRLLDFKRSKDAMLALKQCDTKLTEILRIGFRQLSYFKPFKYLCHISK